MITICEKWNLNIGSKPVNILRESINKWFERKLVNHLNWKIHRPFLLFYKVVERSQTVGTAILSPTVIANYQIIHFNDVSNLSSEIIDVSSDF